MDNSIFGQHNACLIYRNKTNPVTLIFAGFISVGGYEMVKYKFMRSVPNTTLNADPPTQCGRPPQNSFHFFRSIDDSMYPWTGAVFGVTISSVWYWCSDQVCTMI